MKPTSPSHEHHHHRRTGVEEEDEADEGDDDRLLNQGVGERPDRADDQLGSVVRGDQLDAGGKSQSGDFRAQRLDHFQRVRTDPHDDDAAGSFA